MRAFTGFLVSLLLVGQASGQATSAMPAPARKLPAPAIVSPKFVGGAFNIIALSNGNLLVNDIRNHRVMLSDSLLRTTSVVIDSTEYGSRPAALLRYPGDSVLFVEAITPAMILLDPRGKVVRTMAVPNPRDAAWLMPTPITTVGVDARGRLVHPGLAPRVEPPPLKPSERRERAYPDSSPIIRDNPLTHAGDTLTWTKRRPLNGTQVARADGRSIFYSRPYPVAIMDDWGMLADGTIAVVRGRDYHVDLIDAAGKITPLPKISYPWEHISDDQKLALIDSVKKEMAERDKRPSQPLSMSGGSSAGSAGGGSTGGAPAPSDFPPAPPGVFDLKPSDIPDYRAPFSFGAVQADAENNLWIQTAVRMSDTTVAVWDIVNAKGARIDRVLIPKTRSVTGFDARGNVFFTVREPGGVQFIERVRWRE